MTTIIFFIYVTRDSFCNGCEKTHSCLSCFVEFHVSRAVFSADLCDKTRFLIYVTRLIHVFRVAWCVVRVSCFEVFNVSSFVVRGAC